MIEPGSHEGFIVAAYALTAVVIIGMVIWIILDGRAQRAKLGELEARGIRRRSAGSGKS